MAHNLNYNQNTGSYSFFSVKEKAWHGLGKIIQHYPTSKEAIIHAGLDYTVEKRPLFTYDTENHEGDPETELIIPEVEVPGYFATVRNDNDQVLGVVGKDYEVVQNTNAFSFFDAIVGGGDGILYETAGALGNGERIFITAKLPDYIRVGNNDVIEKYIFLTTSHDGSGSITAAFTPIRIVCQNTLNAALRSSSNTIRIRHTANAKKRLEEAHKVLGLSNKMTEQLEGIFNQWAKVRISDSEVKKLIQMAMSPNKETLSNLMAGKDDELSTLYKNTVEDVFAYAMTSESQQMETTKGTVFGAYNAVTGYFQNVRNYKDDEAKVKSLLMGGTAQLRNQSAFNLCSDFAKSGSDIFMFN
jgi:phage/plasmid-like protein (TIGR03299 family)